MSITFWAPQAPTERVQPYEDEPDYFEDRSVLPQINLANSNAAAMLRLMGLDDQAYCGTVVPAEFAPVIERLTRVVNDARERASAVLAPSVSEGALRLVAEGNMVRVVRGPTVYSGGRDDDYVTRRATELLELFVAARREGFEVAWG
jgi:hypothetical protein